MQYDNGYMYNVYRRTCCIHVLNVVLEPDYKHNCVLSQSAITSLF